MLPALLIATVLLVQPGDGALGAADVARLVDDLGSASWAEREAAGAALMAADALAQDVLLAALAREDLSAEQRLRLTRVAAARFRNEPLGGLGVSFGASSEGGVQIQAVVNGFPAAQILRAGDVILAIDDEVVGGQDHVRAEILSREPGAVMPVLVRRDRTVLDLRLPLGAYANLDGAASLDEATVLWAMRLRYGRSGVGLDRPDTIGDRLGGDAWVAAAFPDGAVAIPDEPGDRRGPGIALGTVGMERDLNARRRGVWTTPEEAARAVRDQRRVDLGRAMTSGVRTRSVLVEFERSLLQRIRESTDAGEPAPALEARLAGVRERMARLDQQLTETARLLDSISE
jgi:hypothetical protein